MEWKPIETAPKDGTLILAYDAKGRDTTKHARYYHGSYKDDDGHYYRGSMVEVVCWVECETWRMVQVKGTQWERRRFDNSHWARSQGSWCPTHWMPLPEPPKPA